MTYKTKFFSKLKLVDIEREMNEFMETTDIREIINVLPIDNKGWAQTIIMLVDSDGKPNHINNQSIQEEIKKATEKRNLQKAKIEEHLKHLKG